MISWTTLIVWTISALLAAGIGWSRYEKRKRAINSWPNWPRWSLTAAKNCSAVCSRKFKWKSANSSCCATG